MDGCGTTSITWIDRSWNHTSGYTFKSGSYVYKEGKATVGTDCVVGPYVLIGPDVVIGDKCSIERSVIGADCRIGRGCKVIGSTLSHGVTLENSVIVTDSFIAAESLIKEQCELKPLSIVSAKSVVGPVDDVPFEICNYEPSTPQDDKEIIFLEGCADDDDVPLTSESEKIKRDLEEFRTHVQEVITKQIESNESSTLVDDIRMEINSAWKSNYTDITHDLYLRILTSALLEIIWSKKESNNDLVSSIAEIGPLLKKVQRKGKELDGRLEAIVDQGIILETAYEFCHNFKLAVGGGIGIFLQAAVTSESGFLSDGVIVDWYDDAMQR
eukprot:GHVL01018817.1.p2 GENE.GHVL01018817.1~~GHVL01018817.1.p2  ORF type:complete len:327 (+),score=46.52 GHVL01018817.1:881-1861(+)